MALSGPSPPPPAAPSAASTTAGRGGEEVKGEVAPAETALFQALAATRTSNAWSLLSAMVLRVNRRLAPDHPPADLEQLAPVLVSIPGEVLQRRGVWVEGHGKNAIVCINPAYAQARAAEAAHAAAGDGEPAGCRCSGSGRGRGNREARYFSSHDYNGGRHAPSASTHLASCVEWRPPSSGHLHSWRRGYRNNGAAPGDGPRGCSARGGRGRSGPASK